MSSTQAGDAGAVEAHVLKWLRQCPEMEVALAFAGPERERARLWGALQNEWLEALHGLSDVHVAEVKLAWWGDALADPSNSSTHPLVSAIAQLAGGVIPPGQWQALSTAALELLRLESSPADVAALLLTRLPLARALVAVESALWPQAGTADATTVARGLVLEQWRRHHRQASVQPAWLPLQLLARHGLRARAAYAMEDEAASRALFADLARALLAVPVTEGGSRQRRIRSRLDARILARLAAGRARAFELPGFGLPWLCWRAARGAVA